MSWAAMQTTAALRITAESQFGIGVFPGDVGHKLAHIDELQAELELVYGENLPMLPILKTMAKAESFFSCNMARLVADSSL